MLQDHHAECSRGFLQQVEVRGTGDHLMNRMAERRRSLTHPEPAPQEEALEAADAETSDDNAAISWCEAIVARLMKASNVLQFSQIRDEVYAHPFRDELPQDAMDRLSAALTEAEKRCTE